MAEQPDPRPKRKAPVRRFEFALYDDRGIAVDLATTYPTLEAARDDLNRLRGDGQLDEARTYLILSRPKAGAWRPVPDAGGPR